LEGFSGEDSFVVDSFSGFHESCRDFGFAWPNGDFFEEEFFWEGSFF